MKKPKSSICVQTVQSLSEAQTRAAASSKIISFCRVADGFPDTQGTKNPVNSVSDVLIQREDGFNVDLIFEGRLSDQIAMKDVLMRVKSEPTPGLKILRINRQRDGLNGKIAIDGGVRYGRLRCRQCRNRLHSA